MTTENNEYCLRFPHSRLQEVLDLGVLLGVLVVCPAQTLTAEIPNEDGTTQTITQEVPQTVEAPGGHWDFIGRIDKPTGELFLDPEFGPTPVMAPVLDPDGIPYDHANLSTPGDVLALAEAMAAANPAIAGALANIGLYFLVDEQGNARKPNKPHRVFARA